jgi:MGT family glycosyltransferase
MKSRFLFVVFEGGGNVSSQLGIARRLSARGHSVRVLGDSAVEPDVRAVGCEFRPFQRAPHHNFRNRAVDRVRDWAAKSPIAQLERVAAKVMFGPAAIYAREVLDELARTPADVLAVDYLVFGALVGAEKSGLPTAALVHTPYSMPAPGVPPFGMGLRPAEGPIGRVRDRLLGALQSSTFDRMGLRPLNAARTALGLPALGSVFEQQGRADRVLVLTARSFDLASRAKLPDNVRYVGPELDDPEWARPWTSPWATSGSESLPPLVVVALGSTFQNQHGLTMRVMDALGTLPVRGLITLGDVFSPDELAPPPNVVAVRSAPHRMVFPEARLVVTHGGHGTVMKALAQGVPVLCIPLGRDQGDNAVRVEAGGAGTMVKKSASVATLANAIGQMLTNTALRRRSSTPCHRNRGRRRRRPRRR